MAWSWRRAPEELEALVLRLNARGACTAAMPRVVCREPCGLSAVMSEAGTRQGTPAGRQGWGSTVASPRRRVPGRRAYSSGMRSQDELCWTVRPVHGRWDDQRWIVKYQEGLEAKARATTGSGVSQLVWSTRGLFERIDSKSPASCEQCSDLRLFVFRRGDCPVVVVEAPSLSMADLFSLPTDAMRS